MELMYLALVQLMEGTLQNKIHLEHIEVLAMQAPKIGYTYGGNLLLILRE